jgi:hypothetical protein
MRAVEEYRRHADECRKLASRARTADEKEVILNMAATWDELANTRQLINESSLLP